MITKPHIELRKVHESRALSEETPAYSAQIWVDGAHFCDVSNHGQGGSDMHHPPKGMTGSDLHARLRELETRIAATFPPQVLDAGGKRHEFPASLESVCYGLLDQRQAERHAKRLLGTQVLWLRDGEVRAIPFKNKGYTREQIVEHVRKKEPAARFLHEMPLLEAAALLVR